jgi:hypothetical protein
VALRRVLALAGVALAALGAAQASAGAGLPACALGNAKGAERALVNADLAGARARFVSRLHGSAASRARAGRAFDTAVAAYIYGYPPVSVQTTVLRFPLNQLVSIAALVDPSVKTVVAPNRDTTYTIARLDLSGGPLVLDVPATNGRYYVHELVDAYSNVFGYVGRRTTGTAAGSFVIVPPGYGGALPAGVPRIDSPTPLVWLIGRTLVDSEADLPVVTALMQQYTITPLAAWNAGQRQAPLVLPGFPAATSTRTAIPGAIQFFDALGSDLAGNPPPAADACALRAFAAVGVGPGRTPSSEQTDDGVRAALAAAPAAALKLIDRDGERRNAASGRVNNGWLVAPLSIGNYGTDYVFRAVTARFGLGANSPREAEYPITDRDSAGRRLDGRHDYRITFPAHEPPVNAFWSLTLYNRASFMVPNPLGRYALGDRTPGLRRGRDGSLTIYIGHRKPSTGSSNWLPAPSAGFRLMMRLYQPTAAVLSGRWKPPGVERLDR